ncbi:hypothetical protein OsJ_19552 [Oryza sativa Japonica Group]|uniref:Uncharacterized protein n=1 Tax=Oryza sativa subsp. japonica TaxID=39947 RepID=B9FLM2_ORYSJ|nr:hypothetical protein OsJ_19552 [Oryza sativa Japonica Group]
MASFRLLLLAALLATAAVLAASQKPKAATPTKATPASPGPAAAAADGPAPTNVTAVLEKSGKYTTFLRLLHESRLMLYCVLPRFYSLAMLTTLGGPVNTQASGADGPYKYKIKPSNNNVNISTGVNWALLSTVVSKDFPLAVYSVDKVPLPYELFGPKPPTPAPAPAPAPSKSKTKKHKKSAGIAEPPVADDASADDTTKKAAAPATAVSRWVVAAAGVLAGAILAAL